MTEVYHSLAERFQSTLMDRLLALSTIQALGITTHEQFVLEFAPEEAKLEQARVAFAIDQATQPYSQLVCAWDLWVVVKAKRGDLVLAAVDQISKSLNELRTSSPYFRLIGCLLRHCDRMPVWNKQIGAFEASVKFRVHIMDLDRPAD